MHSRRLAIAMLALGVPTLGTLAARAATARKAVTTDDVSMGHSRAPVTVIEYASVACPVCARFNNDVFPDFKRKYIDTGKVFYVAREMLVHNPQLAGAGYLLARCAGEDKYFQVTDAIYHAQAAMELTGRYRQSLVKIAQDAGMTEQEFDACTQDAAAAAALNTRVNKGAALFDVRSTPTFVINGVKVAEGFISMTELEQFIANAAPAR